MYYKIENGKFTGFYEIKEKEGIFIEISVEDWNNLLNEQSQGKSIYYDSKTKKLDTLKLGKFEELKGDMIITNIELLKQSILSELSELKTEFATKAFIFNEKYLQKNRDVDKANLTSIVVMLNAIKRTVFKNWKFKDLNGDDVYADLSIVDMLAMATIMQTQTTNALIAESKLIKKLETLSVEELKVFDARKEFELMIGA